MDESSSAKSQDSNSRQEEEADDESNSNEDKEPAHQTKEEFPSKSQAPEEASWKSNEAAQRDPPSPTVGPDGDEDGPAEGETPPKWRQEREAFIKAMKISKRIEKLEKDPNVDEEEMEAQISNLQDQIPS